MNAAPLKAVIWAIRWNTPKLLLNGKKILPHLGSVIHNCLTDTKITRCTRWPGWMCQNMWTVDYSVYKWVNIGLWIGDIFLSINSVYLFIYLQRTDWGLMFPEILLDFDQAALVWPQLFDLHFEHCGVPRVWCQDMASVTKISSLLPDTLLSSSGAAEWSAAWRNLP